MNQSSLNFDGIKVGENYELDGIKYRCGERMLSIAVNVERSAAPPLLPNVCYAFGFFRELKILIMKESIIRCPICSKITALEKNGRTQKIEQVHGICWDKIGYSIGGWGSRRDFIHGFSGEVCNDCFTALKTKINEFKEVVDQRRNSCEEGVCIYKTSKDKSTWDNLSDLQEDELQSKRHKTPLLRLLSSFSR